MALLFKLINALITFPILFIFHKYFNAYSVLDIILKLKKTTKIYNSHLMKHIHERKRERGVINK